MKRCADCREYHNISTAAYRDRRHLAGLCVRCGILPPLPGRPTCGCADKYLKDRKTRLLSDGLCYQCANPRERVEIKTCNSCADTYSKRNTSRREKRSAAGTCLNCGGEKKEKSTWCSSCKDADRLYAKQRRSKVLVAYGEICTCCKESDSRFLTIDHIDGGGSKHRRELSKSPRRASSGVLIRWLIKKGFPSGFQILCFNCNCGRAINGGICPHQDH